MEHKHIFIGAKAPEFTAETTFGKISLSDFKDNWVVLFTYPGDFTPVCTSEFIAFSKNAQHFAQRNTQLLALGTDSISSHFAWIHAIKMTSGTEVSFPVISDKNSEILSKYHLMQDEKHPLNRNVFIIDKDKTIRAILCYPDTSGRNVDEILRLLSSLQVYDCEKMLTPANWKCGEAPMFPVPETYSQLVINENECCNNHEEWFM